MFNQIEKLGVLPVIKIDSVENAVPLCEALIAGGLPAAEVTFRTACAAEAIKEITTSFPQMLTGAGTVLTEEQVDKAVEAGAKFIVSPGLNPKVVKHCQSINIPIIPGVVTPGEVEKGLDLGLEVLKFFPAEAAGGLKMIKAMSAPYGSVKFVPTGGINEKNLADYLSFNKVLACGGSFMVTADLINNKQFDKIQAITAEAVNIVKTVRGEN